MHFEAEIPSIHVVTMWGIPKDAGILVTMILLLLGYGHLVDRKLEKKRRPTQDLLGT